MAHLLVVDDDPDIRDLLAYGLTRAGHLVDAARDGEEALARVAEEHYDLMVLDVSMPGISGLEVARTITQRVASGQAQRRPHILMLSALAAERDVAAGRAAGADDYRAKPFSIRDLVARVDEVLSAGTAGP